MTAIELTDQQYDVLANGGYVDVQGPDRMWRLCHETYAGPFPGFTGKFVALDADEIEIIGCDPGFRVGHAIIRRAS